MAIPDGAREILRQGTDDAVRRFLEAHSGLPGPRANLALLALAGRELSAEDAARLRGEASEFLRSCGVLRLAGEVEGPGADAAASAVGELTRFASDESWRVREAVAMAGQRIGDGDPAAMRVIVSRWLLGDDPQGAREG